MAAPRAPGSSAETTRAMRRDLRRIYREADRAAKIVQNLLTFSGSHRQIRRQAPHRTCPLESRWPAAARRWRARASTSFATSRTTVAAVVGDPLLLQQAFLNVIINAEHAIAGTGLPGRS